MRTLDFTSTHGFDASISMKSQLQTDFTIHQHCPLMGYYSVGNGGAVYQDLKTGLFFLVPAKIVATVAKTTTKKQKEEYGASAVIRQIVIIQPELPPVGTRYGVTEGKTWGVLPETKKKPTAKKPTTKKSTENSARSDF